MRSAAATITTTTSQDPEEFSMTTEEVTTTILILEAVTYYLPILGSHLQKDEDAYAQYLNGEIAHMKGLSTDQLNDYIKELKQQVDVIMKPRRDAEKIQKENLKCQAETLIDELARLQYLYTDDRKIFLDQEMICLNRILNGAQNLSDKIQNLKKYITDLELKIRQLQIPIAETNLLSKEVKVADPANISLDPIGLPSPKESPRERQSSSTSSPSEWTARFPFIASFSGSNKNNPSVPTDATNVAAASTAPSLGRSSESS